MNRKIECIERLLEINYSYEEMGEWLVENKFTDYATVDSYKRTKEQAEFIYSTFRQLADDDKIILLYFEWSILPTESIKITCVTPTEERLFTYGL